MGFGSSKSASTNQSQQTSEAKNQAYPFLQEQFGSTTALTNKASGSLMDILGLNGAQGVNEGFNKFKDSSGYNFIQNEGVRGIEGSQASKGMLNSGRTLKGVSKYSSNLANNFLSQYLQQLSGISDTGLKAGSILAQAGNTSQGQGTSSGTSSGSGFNASLK